MKPKARFIQSVIQSAQKCETQMPWARQPRGGASKAERRSAAPLALTGTV